MKQMKQMKQMHILEPILENKDHKTWDDVCSTTKMCTKKSHTQNKKTFEIASDEFKTILREMCVTKFMYFPVRGGTSWDVSGDLLTFGMRYDYKGMTTLEICAVSDKAKNLVIDKIVPLIKCMHPDVKLLWKVRVSSARLKWMKFRVENICPAFSDCIKTVFDEIV
jgi:hypothetical protein